jgi:hypothetical protein
VRKIRIRSRGLRAHEDLAREDPNRRPLREGCARGCHDAEAPYLETMKTGVPTFTCVKSHSASEIRMRTHPCEAE